MTTIKWHMGKGSCDQKSKHQVAWAPFLLTIGGWFCFLVENVWSGRGQVQLSGSVATIEWHMGEGALGSKIQKPSGTASIFMNECQGVLFLCRGHVVGVGTERLSSYVATIEQRMGDKALRTKSDD